MEFLEEDDEEEFDQKVIREKEHNSLDMIITFSNIFAFIWFHRNVFIRLYVTKLLGSEQIFFIFFYGQYSLNTTPIASSILCLNILFEQYTLVLLPFLNHGTYCYNIIQLKYQTTMLPENTVQTYTV